MTDIKQFNDNHQFPGCFFPTLIQNAKVQNHKGRLYHVEETPFLMGEQMNEDNITKHYVTEVSRNL